MYYMRSYNIQAIQFKIELKLIQILMKVLKVKMLDP